MDQAIFDRLSTCSNEQEFEDAALEYLEAMYPDSLHSVYQVGMLCKLLLTVRNDTLELAAYHAPVKDTKTIEALKIKFKE